MSQFADPVEAIQHFIHVTAEQFNDPQNIEGVPVGLLAGETALINETLRCTCVEVFKKWTDVFAAKFLEHGFEQEEAEKLRVTINSMIEGAIMFSLAHKNKEPSAADFKAGSVYCPKQRVAFYYSFLYKNRYQNPSLSVLTES